jgi:hypothetical protein
MRVIAASRETVWHPRSAFWSNVPDHGHSFDGVHHLVAVHHPHSRIVGAESNDDVSLSRHQNGVLDDRIEKVQFRPVGFTPSDKHITTNVDTSYEMRHEWSWCEFNEKLYIDLTESGDKLRTMYERKLPRRCSLQTKINFDENLF